MAQHLSNQQLDELYDWMADEWAANHTTELPPHQYARAVLVLASIAAAEPSAETLAKMAMEGGAFDDLVNEPDLYSFTP